RPVRCGGVVVPGRSDRSGRHAQDHRGRARPFRREDDRAALAKARSAAGVTMRAETITAPVKEETPDTDKVAEPERPWIIIVWNDTISLMEYVTSVVQKLYGIGRG